MADSWRGHRLGAGHDSNCFGSQVFSMNLSIAAALALTITCVIGWGLCALLKWHSKRFLRLPAPQRTAIREVYNEHAYRVGNMSDCK